MPCFHPLRGWKDGGGGISFNRKAGAGVALSVPCGRCIGCRLERSRQWAVRMMHEAQLHDASWFVTLTYDDEHLPDYGSLRPRDFQLFMKRLRKQYPPKTVRFFHCGEYGDNFSRPHYHAALFGPAFSDRYEHLVRGGSQVWRSPTLESAWGNGFSEFSELTFESAAYMARYITKKVTGDAAQDHYQVVDPDTGELVQLEPEYATMSRRPGIGNEWWKRYGKEVFPSNEVIVNGRPQKPPRYYDQQLEKEDPELLHQVKLERREHTNPKDNTRNRLAVRKQVTEARHGLKPRNFENGKGDRSSL